MSPLLRLLVVLLISAFVGSFAQAQDQLTFQKGDIVTILLNDGSVHSRVKVIDVDREFIIVAGTQGAQMINADQLAPVSRYRMPGAAQPPVATPAPAVVEPSSPPPENTTPPPPPAPVAAAPEPEAPIAPDPATSPATQSAPSAESDAPTAQFERLLLKFNPLWLLVSVPAALFLALFLVTRSETAAAPIAAAGDVVRVRRLQCRLTALQLLAEGLAWSLLVVLSLGLAFPFCLLGIGRRLINSVEIVDSPSAK